MYRQNFATPKEGERETRAHACNIQGRGRIGYFNSSRRMDLEKKLGEKIDLGFMGKQGEANKIFFFCYETKGFFIISASSYGRERI